MKYNLKLKNYYPGPKRVVLFIVYHFHRSYVKARGGGGGGVKVDFPVFTYLIRAAGDEQEEKTGPKSDLAFLRYRAPNIEVYM